MVLPTMQKGRRANRRRPLQVWYRGLHLALHIRTIYSVKSQNNNTNSYKKKGFRLSSLNGDHARGESTFASRRLLNIRCSYIKMPAVES